MKLTRVESLSTLKCSFVVYAKFLRGKWIFFCDHQISFENYTGAQIDCALLLLNFRNQKKLHRKCQRFFNSWLNFQLCWVSEKGTSESTINFFCLKIIKISFFISYCPKMLIDRTTNDQAVKGGSNRFPRSFLFFVFIFHMFHCSRNF